MTLPDKALDGVGLIIPPAEIKRVLETTASFLAKKPAVEARIRQKHENDPLFTFLHENDPYHAYFRHRLAEIKTGAADPQPSTKKAPDPPQPSQPNGEAAEPAPSPAPVPTTAGETAAAAPGPEPTPTPATAPLAPPSKTTGAAPVISLLRAARAKAEAARPEPHEPPPADVFTLDGSGPAPPPPFALDVIKLTAQFAARHGPSFLSMLTGKEARNNLFDFLRPIHPHFSVFQRLRDAYRLLLDDGAEKSALVERLQRLSEVDGEVMKEVWYLHDWDCQKAEREHTAAMDESERVKNAQIDWHDFVVLETVDLDDSELNLPPPVADATQLPRILAAARADQREKERNRGDVDMDLDDDDVAAVGGEGPIAGAPVVQKVNVDADIPADRIRREVPPRAGAAGARAAGVPGPATGTATEAAVTLPSGQTVPISKLDASIRTELVDPSYIAERERAAEKQRKKNLADGEEVARNLLQLDQARRDAGAVYNRGDLQEALSGKRARVSDAEVERRLGTATATGPMQPSASGSGSTNGVPNKRARVEAAVDALSKGKKAVAAEKAAAAAAEEEAAAAAARAEEEKPADGLVGAGEWMQVHGSSANIRVLAPRHSGWKLDGQEMEMSAPLKSSVLKLKNVIAKYTGLPPNKQKLHIEPVGFLKDSFSLASYNVKDGTLISLDVKERGRRKRN